MVPDFWYLHLVEYNRRSIWDFVLCSRNYYKGSKLYTKHTKFLHSKLITSSALGLTLIFKAKWEARIQNLLYHTQCSSFLTVKTHRRWGRESEFPSQKCSIHGERQLSSFPNTSTWMILLPKSTGNGEPHENHLYNSRISIRKGEKHFVPSCIFMEPMDSLIYPWVTNHKLGRENEDKAKRERSNETTLTELGLSQEDTSEGAEFEHILQELVPRGTPEVRWIKPRANGTRSGKY